MRILVTGGTGYIGSHMVRWLAAVIHLAASTFVGESVADPATCYQNNMVNSLGLLDACQAVEVDRFVFSSSFATYGVPAAVAITECGPQAVLRLIAVEPVVPRPASLDDARVVALPAATGELRNTCHRQLPDPPGAGLDSPKRRAGAGSPDRLELAPNPSNWLPTSLTLYPP